MNLAMAVAASKVATVILTHDDLELFNQTDKQQNALICQTCGKVFSKSWDLLQHERIHSGEKPFQCPLCGRESNQKSNARKHLLTHKVWPRSVLKTPEDLIQCQKEKGSLHKQYECVFCKTICGSYKSYQGHLRTTHESEKRFHCNVSNCGAFFNDDGALLSHRAKAHPDTLFLACLRGCGKRFSTLVHLNHHHIHRSHQNETVTEGGLTQRKVRHQCPNCPRSFSTAKALYNHELESCGEAKEEEEHPCQICGKAFESQHALRYHFRNHRGGPADPVFRCPLCRNDFASASGLKSHMVIHTDVAEFQCQICDKSFNRKDKLKRHADTHREKTFPCPFATSLGCKEMFTRKDYANNHAAKHGGFNRACGHCPEIFSTPSALAVHRRQVHPRKKSLKCFKCRKMFFLEHQRREHHKEKHGLIHEIVEIADNEETEDDASRVEEEVQMEQPSCETESIVTDVVIIETDG